MKNEPITIRIKKDFIEIEQGVDIVRVDYYNNQELSNAIIFKEAKEIKDNQIKTESDYEFRSNN